MKGLTKHHHLEKKEQASLYPTVGWQSPGQVIPTGAWSFGEVAMAGEKAQIMCRDLTLTLLQSDGNGLGTWAKSSCSVVNVPQETTQGWEEQHLGEGMGTGKGPDGVPHYPLGRSSNIFIDLNHQLNESKCDSKWGSFLTRFDGKYLLHRGNKTVRETLVLWDQKSHEVQKRPPCVLNSFSKDSSGVAGPRHSPRFGE